MQYHNEKIKEPPLVHALELVQSSIEIDERTKIREEEEEEREAEFVVANLDATREAR